jgi:hypothetical protein
MSSPTRGASPAPPVEDRAFDPQAVSAVAPNAPREQARDERARGEGCGKNAGRDSAAAQEHCPDRREEGERLPEGHSGDVEDVLQADVRSASEECDAVAQGLESWSHDLAFGDDARERPQPQEEGRHQNHVGRVGPRVPDRRDQHAGQSGSGHDHDPDGDPLQCCGSRKELPGEQSGNDR